MHRVVFISGLPGAGKSTVSKIVAEKLKWEHIDADDFLPESMKLKIKGGELLSDDEVDTWVNTLVLPQLIEKAHTHPVVAAGHLVKNDYIEKLSHEIPDVVFVNLLVPREVLVSRIQERDDHFAQEKVFEKCWNEKERYFTPGLEVDGSQSLEEVASEIISLIQ